MLFRFWIACIPHERDALIDLDHSRVQRRRAANVKVEDLGTRLVADQEEIFEALRDEQGVLLAFALEEGIGSNGGGKTDIILNGSVSTRG